MKYGDITFGQAEAVFNKLGGADGVARFLAGELIIIESEKSAHEQKKVLSLVRSDIVISALTEKFGVEADALMRRQAGGEIGDGVGSVGDVLQQNGA